MKTRLASLFLVLVLAGSAVAGVPLNFGDDECSMHMDCCKVARTQAQTPEVAEAKLCCALNCAQNGTTSPPKVVRVAIPPAHPVLHASSSQLKPTSSLRFHHFDRLHGPPNKEPAYLRNLVLLI